MQKNHLLVLALILMALSLIPGTAIALADPDVIQIETANRYDDVAVAGDMFILVEYTLLYNTLPTESISEGWLGRLIDVGGAGQLASQQPFSGGAIPDLGYSRGVYGFYFTVEPTITGDLRVTLEGNPTLSPTPDGIFTEAITQRNASDLANDLRIIALRFEDIWEVDLVSPLFGGVNRYTEDGEEYFVSALPNLRAVAPDMFVLHSVTIKTPNRTFSNNYANSREALFDGTVFATGLNFLAIFLNTSETVARFLVAFVFTAVVVFVIIRRVPGVTETGFSSTLVIWTAYLCMMGGFWIGLVTAATLGILTVLAIMVTAVIFFLQRTSV